jgi:hypothetical protein
MRKPLSALIRKPTVYMSIISLQVRSKYLGGTATKIDSSVISKTTKKVSDR